jgi:hypothetical protein
MMNKTDLSNVCSQHFRRNNNANMIFQNFDIALYIKEFIGYKYALPYYLTCQSTMVLARQIDNEFEEIKTCIFEFCSTSSLLRWAIDMYIPIITARLFARVCGHGILSDVIMLHEVYKCSFDEIVAFENAIANGQMHIVQYLCDISTKYNIQGADLCGFAIEYGQLDILEWLWSKYKIKQCELWDLNSTCAYAAKNNHINVLAWLQSKSNVKLDGKFWIESLCAAAENGNIELLKWLCEQLDYDINICQQEEIILEAVASGHLKILEWIGSNLGKHWDVLTCQTAAKYGQLHILQWLRSLDPPCPWNKDTFKTALLGKHNEISDWLQTVEPSCPFDSTTLDLAVVKGDMKLVQWLRSQTPSCPYSYNTCRIAIYYKHLDILQWLIAHNATFDWSKTHYYASIALLNNDLNTMKWLQAMAPLCSWDKIDKACENAIEQGNLEMLQWLMSQNCVLTKDCFLLAVVNGHIGILQWLYTHYQESFNQRTKYVMMKEAARYGLVHIMKWLYSLNPSFKWDRGITNAAARGNKLNALLWLRSQDPPLPWNERNLYFLASSTGNIMLMKCLRHLNPSYPYHYNFCAKAAKNGHLRMLRWLRCQDPPCPINWIQCIKLASNEGEYEVKNWLLQNNNNYSQHN